jgi:hypothetical protein
MGVSKRAPQLDLHLLLTSVDRFRSNPLAATLHGTLRDARLPPSDRGDPFAFALALVLPSQV